MHELQFKPLEVKVGLQYKLTANVTINCIVRSTVFVYGNSQNFPVRLQHKLNAHERKIQLNSQKIKCAYLYRRGENMEYLGNAYSNGYDTTGNACPLAACDFL